MLLTAACVLETIRWGAGAVFVGVGSRFLFVFCVVKCNFCMAQWIILQAALSLSDSSRCACVPFEANTDWPCSAYSIARVTCQGAGATCDQPPDCHLKLQWLAKVQSACVAMPVLIPSDAGPAKTFQELLRRP